MIFPALTATYAAVLALIYVGLSAWVIAGRVSNRALHGDAGDKGFAKRIRSHANFIEYVPLTLLLIALLEGRQGSTGFVHALLAALIIARLVHPIGMFAPVNSPRQFACRGGGIIATLAVMAIAAIALLA